MSHKKSVKRQKVLAVILAGRHDFGRCPVAMRLPTALWLVGGKPVLQRLLNSLAEQGIERAVICSNSDSSLLADSVHSDSPLEIRFLDERLPVGTAGCIRDAAANEKNTLIVVFPASIVCPPNVDDLIKAHRDSKADLTVMFNPDEGNGRLLGEPASIYVCESDILKYIPRDGYLDIKEGLIPAMLSAGKTVHAVTLTNHAGNFRDRREYLFALAAYFENAQKVDEDLDFPRTDESQDLWASSDATVEPGARIFGPVTVMDGARISDGAIVFGPTIVGRNVSIGRDSIVINSVLWDGAKVGPNCQIRHCLIDYNITLSPNTVVEEKAVPFRPKAALQGLLGGVSGIARNSIAGFRQTLQPQLGKINEILPDWVQTHKTKVVTSCAICLLSIVFLWSYWPGLSNLWDVWRLSDEYSSGLLVPFLAAYILWVRRQDITQCRIGFSIWGLFAFIAAQGLRLFGLYFGYVSAENLSIVLSISALVLFLFGRQFFKKISTVLLFLCLMLPWPNRIQAAVALPLQGWATSSAVFCLEMMGYAVIQEGNIIHINETTIAVAEACNGLRMITAFFVISALVVMLARRPWWVKFIILLSSLPVALLCNTVRLTITALAFTVLKGEYWVKIFHDFGGYAMMPLAVIIVVAELWLLVKLTTLPVEEDTVIITRQKG
jgi:exosortase